MRIRDVCSRFSSGKGITASRISNTGLYPVYGGNGLRGYTDSYNFSGDCAIIGRQGAYCGNVKFFSGKAYMTEHAIVAVANERNNTRFLAYKFGLMDLGRFTGQSAQPGLSVETLLDVEIEVPDRFTQDKIASLLSNLDEMITNNVAISSELEAMAKLLYDYWFVQFDFPDENGKPYKSSGGKMVWNEELKREIPVFWNVQPLSYYLECNQNTISIAGLGEEISYLDTGNLTENVISEIQNKKVADGIPSRARRIIKENDILYSTVRPIQKHYGIIKHPVENMIASTGFAVLSTKQGSLYNDLFYLFITTESNLKTLDAIANNSVSSYPSINPDAILNLKIALPNNITVLDDMCRQIQNYFELIDAKQKENKKLEQIRDFLLPMLMNGQVKVKDSIA